MVGGVPMGLVKGRSLVGARSGTLAGMEVDPAVELSGDGNVRPCDFCGHSVKVDSVDEYECPVCGEPPEAGSAEDSA